MESTKSTVKNLTKDQKMELQRDQLQELKQAQIDHINGVEEFPTVTANRNKKYKIKANEQGYVHVKTKVNHLAQDQKSFTPEENIIKIHAREFDRRVAEGAFKTYDEAEVIHDPRQNAPEKYSLKPDVAKVDNSGPVDKNVSIADAIKANKGSNKTQAAKMSKPEDKAPENSTDQTDLTPNDGNAPTDQADNTGSDLNPEQK